MGEAAAGWSPGAEAVTELPAGTTVLCLGCILLRHLGFMGG